MASSKQTKRILNQGKQIAKSVSNKRQRFVCENERKAQDTDDSQEESNVQEMNTNQSSKQGKRPKVIRPNAFLSFRITNQQIIDHASELQKEIIESNPLLSKASISLSTLHITLMVFALKTDDDKQRAQKSLLDVYNQVKLADLPSPQITFAGVSHFNNKVLYMNPVKDAHLDVLTRIAEICRETYENNGIKSTDDRSFNPHLTLFKLSKARDLYRKGVKKIDEFWSSKYTDLHFGIENFRSIHLCNMLKKQNDGYYEIFHEQHLFNDDSDSFRPPSPTNVNEAQISVETCQVVPSSEEVDQTVEAIDITERQTVIIEPSIDTPTATNESSPLLQHDLPATEQSPSGLTKFFRHPRFHGCACCTIA